MAQHSSQDCLSFCCKMCIIVVLICLISVKYTICESIMGPDPWEQVTIEPTNRIYKDSDIPPDLRLTPKRKVRLDNIGTAEWFYRRLLGIVLKGGQVIQRARIIFTYLYHYSHMIRLDWNKYIFKRQEDIRAKRRTHMISIFNHTFSSMTECTECLLVLWFTSTGVDLFQKDEDGNININMQMAFNQERWDTLEKNLLSDSPMSEDMFRRSLGYLEEAIRKPTMTDKIVMAWNEYIVQYLEEYKMYISYTFGILAGAILAFWLWNNISQRHLIMMSVLLFYIYEAFISYKEAEKKEYEAFLNALHQCKWYFWKSDCEIPPPDPLVFIKHMNPLKIALRVFSTIVSEPMITIGDTIKIMLHGITDGLWFPLDKIAYGVLVLSINIMLIFFIVMIIFNYLLNIPFHLNFFAGLFSIGMKQRKRCAVNENMLSNNTQIDQHNDRISGATLHKLLDICSHAIHNQDNTKTLKHLTHSGNTHSNKLQRSASTGRLISLGRSCFDNVSLLESKSVRKRHVDGSGDAS